MKVKILKVLVLSFICLNFICCKKSSTGKFSLDGCSVYSSDDNDINLYKEPGKTEVLCTVPAKSELEVKDYEDLQIKVKYAGNNKTVTGWVYLKDIGYARDIFLQSLEPALRGNEDAAYLLNFGYKDLNFDNAMETLEKIISIVGKERFKTINPDSPSDKIIFKALSSVVAPGNFLSKNNFTRPIHLLADCANKATLEYFYPEMRDVYEHKGIDSAGRSCHMRAVSEQNLEALQFYYEHNIAEAPDEESHKDNRGNTLETYVMRCPPGPTYNFMNSVLMTSEKNIKKFYDYLEGEQYKEDFTMMNILFEPVPYTEYLVEHPDTEMAFVFMFSEEDPEWHFIDYNGVLNLREEGSLNSKVIGKLYYGMHVLIEERSAEKTEINGVSDYWYKVQSKGDAGWCWGGYLVYPERVRHPQYQKGEGPVTTYSQTPFEENALATVIEDTNIYLIDGSACPVKAFDEVTVLKKLYDYDHSNLWDYGEMDANSWECVFCPRYHYYLVRDKDYRTGIIGGSHIVHEKLDTDFYDKSHKPDFDFYVNYLVDEDDFECDNPNYESHYYAELFEVKKDKMKKLNPAFTLWNRPEPVPLASDLTKKKVYLVDYCDFEAEYNYYHETGGERLMNMYSLILRSSGSSKFTDYLNYRACTVLDVEGRYEMFDSFNTDAEESSGSTFDSSKCYFVQNNAGEAPELHIEFLGRYIDYDSYEETPFTGTHNYKDYSNIYKYFFNRDLCYDSEDN